MTNRVGGALGLVNGAGACQAWREVWNSSLKRAALGAAGGLELVAEARGDRVGKAGLVLVGRGQPCGEHRRVDDRLLTGQRRGADGFGAAGRREGGGGGL